MTMQSDWRKVTLNEVTDLTLSSVDKKTKPNEHAVKLCNYMDVYNNSFIHDGLPFMEATATEREISRCALRKGDVVITKDSEKYDDIGIPTVINEDIPNLVCGYHLAILRPISKTIDGKYLFYALNTREVQHQFHAYANGVTRFGLRKADIGRIEIPLPPLLEQRRIAHILGTLDDKIELNRRMNATLEGMAQGLFKSWFVDFEPVRAKMEGRWRHGESLPGMPAELYDLFPERLVPSELGEVPEGWTVKALGEIIELAYGKSLRADKRLGGHIPVYGSNGQVGWHNEKLVDGPGVIVGRKGNPGIVAWSHMDFYPIDTTFYVKSKDAGIGFFFLHYALKGQNLPSVAADSAVPGLNRNLAYMNRQLVPRAEIVSVFDLQVETLFSQTHCLEEESRILADLRDALLPRLMSGNVKLQTPT